MTKPRTSSEKHGPKVNWRLFCGLFTCVAAIVLVCYGNTLAYGIVFNDELTLLFAGKQGQHGNFLLDALLRPLTQGWVRQSYLLDERNYSAAFGWYHLVNVYFHWVAAAALFGLVFRLAWRWHNQQHLAAEPYRVAIAAALVFACHPLTAESASYISARYSCLGGCNYLLSLNLFLLGLFAQSTEARLWGYGLCALFGWMSLSSSEVGLSLPLALLSLFFLVRPRQTNWKDWALDRPILVGILLALVICTPFALLLGFEPAAVPNHYGMGIVGPMSYYATQTKTFIAYYLRCFLVPLGLAIDPPFSLAGSWADPLSILGAVALAAFAYCLYRFRSRPLLVLGLGLTLLGFLPHALILQMETASDPSFYLSVAGLSVVVAALLEPYMRGSRQTLAERLLPVVLVLGALSVIHNLDFRNDAKLVAATLKVNPESAVAYVLDAGNSAAERHFDQSLSAAEKAIALAPDSARAWFAKGTALQRLGQPVDAESALVKAAYLADRQKLPLGSMVRFALAENYIDLRKLDDAEKILQRALIEDSHNPRAVYMLGRLAYERKQYTQAVMYLDQAYQHGVMETLQPLADCALHLKKYDIALRLAQQAVTRDGNDARAQLVLANAALLTNRLPQAERALQAVLRTQPHDAVALALSSMVAERKDEATLAKTRREDAIKIDANVFSHIVLPEPDNERKKP